MLLQVKLIKIEKHPDAEKLSVCQVNIGSRRNTNSYSCN